MSIFNFQFPIFKKEESLSSLSEFFIEKRIEGPSTSSGKIVLQKGFTLIELLLAIGIAGILLTLTTAGLLGAQRTTSIVTAEENITTDIKSQQIKAMNGISGGGKFGIHFANPGTNIYTLFQGASFVAPGSPVTADDNITYSCTSGCTNFDIVFSQPSGEIFGYTTPPTITVKNIADNSTKQIILNKYGVITGD